MPLRYALGSEVLIHAEWQQFLSAHQNEAADSLAIMAHLAAAGMGALDASYRDGFGIARPYCHQAAGWAVFFEVEGPYRGKCDVSLLLAADLEKTPIETAKRQAARRRKQDLGIKP
jgi:hypothetical protein